MCDENIELMLLAFWKGQNADVQSGVMSIE